MKADPLDNVIAAPLLRYLQIKLRQSGLRYLKTPARFAGGVGNRVYGFHLQDAAEEFSKPVVLRLFSQYGDATRVRREFALQNALADLRSPAPRVFIQEDDSIPRATRPNGSPTMS
jgi:aminoglycoside phosphotransferase (APT) family kinase protein